MTSIAAPGAGAAPAPGTLYAWFAATSLCLMAVGGYLQQSPVWNAGTGKASALLAVSAAYAVGGIGIAATRTLRGRVSVVDSAVLMMAALGAALFAVVLLDIAFSRRTLLVVCAAMAALTLLPFVLPRRLALGGAMLAALTTPIAGIASAMHRAPPTSVTERTVTTSLYTLRLRIQHNAVPFDSVRGGGLARIGDSLIVATGDGRVYLATRAAEGYALAQTPLTVPLNAAAFTSEMTGTTAPTQMFRVAGFAVQELGTDSLRILASHHWWDAALHCFVLRVSHTRIPRDRLLTSQGTWSTLFETTPCLPIKARGRLFNGSQAGGRMIVLDANTLLLAVGDHEFDGVNALESVSQDSAGSYGKTLRINLTTGKATIASIGHRNPQGLVQRRSGDVWLTEHGPNGGDELNQMRAGVNYGWPLETYGTNYGVSFWPLSAAPGRHDRFGSPAFAWTPSIGVSSLIEVTTDSLAQWRGDLLVGSLVAQTLFRVRVDSGHVRFAEPISVGHRVRDLVETTDGRIVLWLDGGGLATLEPSSGGTEGARHFSALCGGCHMVQDGDTHGIGPDLAGIASRRVASATNFRYSEALASVGGRWSAARLDALLRNGQQFAPGMAMADVVVSDSATRAAIVEYLRSLQ